MKARIEKENCIGCALCEGICPDGIKMTNRKAEIIDENVDCIKDAADACPRGAIILN